MGSFVDKLKSLGQLGEKELMGGEKWIVFPDNIPMVGDLVVVRDSEGNETPAPDGSHETVDGWFIATEASEIIAVTEPTEEGIDADVENPTENIEELSAENQQLSSRAKEVESTIKV